MYLIIDIYSPNVFEITIIVQYLVAHTVRSKIVGNNKTIWLILGPHTLENSFYW